jgi:hypothetical protein
MKIPIFVSCPTVLNVSQDKSRKIILSELEHLELEPRAIGRSDYPTELPLKEVYLLAKHCSGGIILGFEQFLSKSVILKRDTKEEEKKNNVKFPTPWNQIEAGILFSLGLPLLVFREEGISGGVFDRGVTDVFIHKMPLAPIQMEEKKALTMVFLKWQASVREHYYR